MVDTVVGEFRQEYYKQFLDAYAEAHPDDIMADTEDLSRPDHYLTAYDTPFQNLKNVEASPNFGRQKKNRIPMSKDTPGIANRNNGISTGIQEMANEIAEQRQQDDVIVGTNIDLYRKQSQDYVKKVRNDNLWNLTVETGFGRSIEDSFDRWLHRDDERITDAQAQELSKIYGVDLKWNSKSGTLTRFEALQRIDKALSVQQYTAAFAEANAALYDSNKRKALESLGISAGATFFGTPFDFAATAAMFAAPPALVGKAAQLSRLAAEGITMARASRIMASTKNAISTEKAIALALQSNPGYVTGLTKAGNMTYNSLNWTGKMLADAGGSALTDVPFALAKKYNSDQLGGGFYDEKDLMTELLMVGAAGTALPAMVRAAGRTMGFFPKEMLLKRASDAKIEVAHAHMKGDITDAEALARVQNIDQATKIALSKDTPRPRKNYLLENMSQRLEESNISAEDAKYNVSLILKTLAKGDDTTKIALKNLRNKGDFYSHVSHNVLKGFQEGKTAREVFGDHLLTYYNKDTGYASSVVSGDSGFLGLYKSYGRSIEEAEENLADAYKAFIFDDEEAFERLSEKSIREQSFYEEIRKTFDEYKKRYEENAAGKKANGAKYTGTELLNLEDIFHDAYLRYKMTPAQYQDLDNYLRTKDLSEATGAPVPAEPTDLTAFDKEAAEFTSKWVYRTDRKIKTKSGEEIDSPLFDFRNAKGEKDLGDNMIARPGKNVRKGYDIEKWLDDWQEMNENNSAIVNSDSFYQKMDAERVLNLVEEFNNPIRSTAFTELDLLGLPRKQTEEILEDVYKAQGKKDLLTRNINNYTEYIQSEEFKPLMDIYSRNQLATKRVGKIFDALNRLQEVVDTRYRDVISNVVTSLRNSESVSKAAKLYLDTGNRKAFATIFLAARDQLKVHLQPFIELKYISEREATNTINEIIGNLSRNYEKDADKIKPLLNDIMSEETRANFRVAPDLNARATMEERVKQLEASINEYKTYNPKNKEFKGEYPESSKIATGAKEIRDLTKAQEDRALQISELREQRRNYFAGTNKDWRREKVVQLGSLERKNKEAIKDLETRNKAYQSQWEKAEKEYKKLTDDLASGKQTDDAYYENRVQEEQEITELMQPLVDAMDSSLYSLMNRTLYVQKRTLQDLVQMIKKPAIAQEILIGKATQSLYVFPDAGRSVEYDLATSGNYLTTFSRNLNEIDKTGSLDIIFRSQDQQQVQGIYDAFIDRKHGITSSANSNEGIIAQQMDQYHARSTSGLERYGSDYVPEFNMVDAQKLRNIDGYVPKREEAQIRKDFSTDKTDIELFKDALQDEDKVFRWGLNELSEEEATKKIEENIAEIKELTDSFFHLERPEYQSIVNFVLRDLDLDKMFNKHSESMLSLNDIRDALRTGKWDKVFVFKDIQEMIDVVKALKLLRTNLIGDIRKGRISEVRPTTSFAFRFYNSFDIKAASTYGEKLAYINEREAQLHFLNPDKERRFIRAFGYDSAEVALKKNIEQNLRARAVLHNYGPNPVEYVHRVADMYNSICKDTDYAFDLERLANSVSKKKGHVKWSEKYLITEEKMRRILTHTIANTSNPDGTKGVFYTWAEAIMGIASSPLLVKAGLRSGSDLGTIAAGLAINGYVNNAVATSVGGQDTMDVLTRTARFMIENPDIMELVSAATVLTQADLARKAGGVISDDILANSTRGLSKTEKIKKSAAAIQDFFYNKIGRIQQVTDSNVRTASLSIQNSMTAYGDLAFDKLDKHLQNSMLREGITPAKWDLMRKYTFNKVKDFAGIPEYMREKISYGDMKFFDPYEIMYIPEDALREAMAKDGYTQISAQMAHDYRADFFLQGTAAVNSAAREMVSMPSQRIITDMMMGFARSSPMGLLISEAMRYQSFGASMLYNTYAKRIAFEIADETGITVLDCMNPVIKVDPTIRKNIRNTLISDFTSVALASLVFDTLAEASVGNIQLPSKDRPKENVDLLVRRFGSPLGVIGTTFDTLYEAFTGVGQGAGGINIQAFPAISNVTRATRRITKPLWAKGTKGHRGEAFSSAVASEILQQSPAMAPFIGLAFNAAFKWKLDEIANGRKANKQRIKNMEKQGYFIFPWQKNPDFIWNRLND